MFIFVVNVRKTEAALLKCELNGQLIRVKLKHRMKLIRVNMYEVQRWLIANIIFRIAKIETPPLKIRNSLDYSF